jgi:hypothetical protein
VKVVARTGATVLLVLLGAGCGRHVVPPDSLAGAEVGRMAEHELEAENPRLAPGTLRCPDLDFRVGASVRCLRTADLGQGRVVKVAGTVAVTSLASGGRLHVALDDTAQEFGISGDQVATELRRRYAQLFGGHPGAVECPYLRGAVGNRVTCRVQVGGARRAVDAVVTRVDRVQYRTVCAFRPHGAPS